MNILFDNIIVKGGWVMVPIILGSVFALGFSIERWVFFWRIKLKVAEFADDIYFLVNKGEYDRALERCGKVNHPIGAVFRAGLEKRNEDILSIERSMEREGNNQVPILEKNFVYLVVIIGAEPMLGFLGTILGLIQAFMIWEQYSATVTVDRLAAGIYQAMITTAGGLLVAIPFYVIYSYFTNKVNMTTRDLNYYGDKLVDIINAKKRAGNEN